MPAIHRGLAVVRTPQVRGKVSEDEKPMDWEAAKAHFDAIRAEYQSLQGVPGVNTTLAFRLTFEPLAVRYNRGERSRDLYDSMLAVE